MAKSNFERMIELAEKSFDARHDPQQLDVNQKVLKQLEELHPATMAEYDDGNGPVVWILLIPTTHQIMNEFVEGKLGETELLNKTPRNAKYDAIYLCSAMVLEEYRGKGIAKRLTRESIDAIMKDHPVETLFVWPFSEEGRGLAESIARTVGKKLLVRE